ncbi:hypothetical protein PF003_g27908 [Phytophthora fragariae]|nr:hypothetical protein PF003_g27908 [Phytophthora fragariae]
MTPDTTSGVLHLSVTKLSVESFLSNPGSCSCMTPDTTSGVLHLSVT